MREILLQRGTRRLSVFVQGTGTLLLFAHGLSGTHLDATWLDDVAAGFRLVTPDLFGRGGSVPAPLVEDHRFEEHAADLLAIIDHLDADSAVVGGTSFGAAVAAAFAVAYPQRVKALVLIASAFGARGDAMGEGDLQRYGVLADRMDAEGVHAVARSEAARVGSERPIQRWTAHDEPSLIAFLRAVPLYRPFDRVADLERVTAPTLVYPGSDEIHTPELSASYTAALPNATSVDAGTPLRDAVASFLERFH